MTEASREERGGVRTKEMGVGAASVLRVAMRWSEISTRSSLSLSPAVTLPLLWVPCVPAPSEGGVCDQVPFGSIVTWSIDDGTMLRISWT